MMPKRFDTLFYAARADSEQLATATVGDGGCEWIARAQALRMAEAGRTQGDIPDRIDNLLLLRRKPGATGGEERAAARKL